jgi:hypothetical protein
MGAAGQPLNKNKTQPIKRGMNMLARIMALAGMLLISAMSTGCASITGSEIQSISLNAQSEQGTPVEKASCELTNDKGMWSGVTPGFIQVRRSAEDLLVTCKKAGERDGQLRAISRAAGGMFGNIIFGGGIGAIIDHNKGTGYDYPDSLMVRMGASGVRDKQHERDEAQLKAAGNPAAGTTLPTTPKKQ